MSSRRTFTLTATVAGTVRFTQARLWQLVVRSKTCLSHESLHKHPMHANMPPVVHTPTMYVFAMFGAIRVVLLAHTMAMCKLSQHPSMHIKVSAWGNASCTALGRAACHMRLQGCCMQVCQGAAGRVSKVSLHPQPKPGDWQPSPQKKRQESSC